MNEYEAEMLRIASERGYTITGKYVTALTRVAAICPKGHVITILPSSFKRGAGCGICAGKCSKSKAADFEAFVTNKGFKLLTQYVNNKSKVELLCDNGHLFNTRPNDTLSGHGCPICTSCSSEQAKLDFEALVSDRGFLIISKYKGTDVKIEMLCPEGHLMNTRPSSFKNGGGCAVCAGKSPEAAEANFRKVAEVKGYEVIGSYKNTKHKVEMICSEGHSFKMMPNDITNGHGCTGCAKTGYDASKKGYLYILRHEYNNHFKVGISNSYKKRIANLRLATPFDFDVVAVFKGDGREIIDLEQAIHKTMPSAGYKGFDGCTEWIITTNGIILLPEVLGLKHA